jgi:hypothetical protein
MNDGLIEKNLANNGAVYLGNYAEFTMNNGTIGSRTYYADMTAAKNGDGNQVNSAYGTSGVYMTANSKFILEDGWISGNSAYSNVTNRNPTAGLNNSGGYFDMRGGKMINNLANAWNGSGGNAIKVFDNGTIKMSGDAEIGDGFFRWNATIQFSNSNFIMEGGAIRQNAATTPNPYTYRGYIVLEGTSTFTMTGGWIDDVIAMADTATASISGNGIIKQLNSGTAVIEIAGELTPDTNAVNISNPQNSGASSPSDKTKSIQSLLPDYTNANDRQVLAGSGLIAGNKDKIALSNPSWSISDTGRLVQP